MIWNVFSTKKKTGEDTRDQHLQIILSLSFIDFYVDI